MWVTVIVLVALCATYETAIVHRIPSHTSRSFSNNVLTRALNEYRAIAAGRNTTIREMRKKALEWGEKYGLKKEVEEFYQTQNKKAEEKENKTIAVLENAAKAYRDYLALFDDSKTLEQIDKGEEKLRSEKPKEYSVFMYASRINRDDQNPILPQKFKAALLNSWP